MTKKTKLTSGIFIPKDHTEFIKIEGDLSRSVMNWDGSSSILKLYIDYPDKILIPRFYPINDTNIIKSKFHPDTIDINLNDNIEVRSEIQQSVIDYIDNNKNGIIKLRPGAGKTFIAIYSICKLKKRTIIVTHKEKLLEQWQQEFLKFTDLKEDDICKLSTKNFKHCLSQKIILCTPQVIAYAVKNADKCKDFLKELLQTHFGVMFVDELHSIISGEKFSHCSLLINAEKVFGLSATPLTNKNDDIKEYHLGKLHDFDNDSDEILIPDIFVIKKDFNVNRKSYKYINWGGKFNIIKYYKQLKKSPEYIELMSKIINKLYTDGRNVLVLGNIIDQLISIGLAAGIDKSDCGVFIAGAKKADILKISDVTDLNIAFNTKRIVYATYGMARDGTNRPNLDALLLTTPCSNIIQAIGRIQRSCENKRPPIVFDFVDIDNTIEKFYNKDTQQRVQRFERSFQYRYETYNKFKWPVKLIDKNKKDS